MLSDEERKAIKKCDIIFINLEDMMSEEGANDYRKSYRILKNLIEKQQKEIEELKAINKMQKYRIEIIDEREFISKNTIIAKIEEYQKQIEKMEKDDIGVGFTLGKEWSDLKAKVEFGRTLLEKE